MRLQYILLLYLILLVTPFAIHSQTSLFKQNLPFKSCFDHLKNGDEADSDCGGSCKKTCDIAQSCYVNSDCQSNYCNEYSLCEQNPKSQRALGLISEINPLIAIALFILVVGLVIICFYIFVKIPQKDIILEKQAEKKSQKTELMENPLEQGILKLYYSGLKSNQIAQQLREQGFSNSEIIDAFNQLKTKLIALQQKKNNQEAMPQ